MTGLGIVLQVEHTTHSYAFAGVVAAVYILTSAVAAPVQGRLADRIGQRPVLLTASSLYAAGIAALLTSVGEHLSLTLLAAVIAGTGAPQTGNMVRTRWTHAAPDRHVLSTAFALEAIFDEVVFIVGPVLVTFLTLNAHPPLGLSAAAGAALIGAWGLALQQGSAPVVERVRRGDKPPLDLVSLGALIVAAVGVGVVFGSSEILIVAFTDEQGQKSLAGWVLAISSVGSLFAGFVVGARQSVSQPVHRLRLFTLLLMASLLPLPLAHTTLQLTIGMFIMGLTIAPT
ncbi:MAG: TCR/Tet family MFS transporter, partial [Porphyromonadaceae bacterium]|nr:TCR/Tet family MFS transporter [Porphyromonadaceae bacterium]